MIADIGQAEHEYTAAYEAAEVARSARNERAKALEHAQADFAESCNEVARAEDRLHRASEQLTEARSQCRAGVESDAS